MPTSHGTSQKEQDRIVSDGRALLKPYAPKRSEKKNKKSLKQKKTEHIDTETAKSIKFSFDSNFVNIRVIGLKRLCLFPVYTCKAKVNAIDCIYPILNYSVEKLIVLFSDQEYFFFFSPL